MGSKPAGAPQGRVLVVDDDAAVGRSFDRLLSAAGFAVVYASDGATAIAELGGREFDVVLSDISMPGMDGIQLLRAVRARDLDLPVVMVTGTPALETATKAIEYGALRYLVKPVESRELVDVVTGAVRLRRMASLKRQALEMLGNIDKQVSDRAGLEASLGRALETLWMAYQPIVSWSARAVFAYEALVRAEEPTLPHPGALVNAALQLGRLPDLSRAIRASAAAPIDRAGPESLLFVNLHPSDLDDEDLYDPAAPLGTIAHRVVLEITERAPLHAVRDVRTRVATLKQLGYRIALDDLGAGYAGLSSFAELTPDVVKLDMSLVRGVDQEPPRQKLIRSMVNLCHEMNIQVVAEGVETVAERDRLIELGCDLFQGYLFARPGRPFPAPTW